MSEAVIGALRATLGIDTAAWNDGLAKAQGALGRFGSIARTGALAVAAAAATAGGALAVAVRGTINAADDMADAAEKVGIPIEALSRLKYAAEQNGVSFAGLQTAVGKLSQNMAAAATGTGEQAEAFARLGIAVADADGKLRPAEDVLADLADRFAAMPDGAEKTAAAMELMGRSGRDMIPMLNDGSAALGELLAEADSFGQVFTAEMGENAETFNQNMTRVQGTFAAISADIAERLLPHLADFSEWLVRNGPAIVDGVGGALDAVASAADKVGGALKATRDRITEAKGAVREFLAEVVRVRDEVVATMAALPGEFAAIGRDMIDGLLAGIRERWEALKATVGGVMQGIADWARQVSDTHSPSRVFADIGRDLMAGLSQGITANAAGVEGEVGRVAQQLASSFAGILTGATEWRDAMAGILDSIAGRLIEAGIGAFGRGLGIPGFANGTGFAPGGLALVGERGPELVNLPRGSRVTPNHMLGAGGGQLVTVAVRMENNGNLQAYVQNVATRASGAAVSAYDRQLPDRVSRIGADPYFRG